MLEEFGQADGFRRDQHEVREFALNYNGTAGFINSTSHLKSSQKVFQMGHLLQKTTTS